MTTQHIADGAPGQPDQCGKDGGDDHQDDAIVGLLVGVGPESERKNEGGDRRRDPVQSGSKPSTHTPAAIARGGPLRRDARHTNGIHRVFRRMAGPVR